MSGSVETSARGVVEGIVPRSSDDGHARPGHKLLRVWVSVDPAFYPPKTYERLYTVEDERLAATGEPGVIRLVRSAFTRDVVRRMLDDDVLFGSRIERIRTRWED